MRDDKTRVNLPGPRPLLLASVKNAEEAYRALSAGADILDCKDPSRGTLGALEAGEIGEIVSSAHGKVPVSATIGDLPAHSAELVRAAEQTAALGVQIVKCGFFGANADAEAAAALSAAKLSGARLFGVLMADRVSDFSLITHLAKAGFLGVMLDTADKAKGSLVNVLNMDRLETFVNETKAAGLVAGLAGSLGAPHVRPLATLGPDILGFRGGLCNDGRGGTLIPSRVAAISGLLEQVREAIAQNAPALR